MEGIKMCTAIDNERCFSAALTPNHWRNFILATESAAGSLERRQKHNRMIIKY
jgi:hypothetical protein